MQTHRRLTQKPGRRVDDFARDVLWTQRNRTSLLAYGAPLNLFEASAVGAPDRVQELVTAQPYRIESFAVDGFTALGLAAFFGHADIVDFHLIRGADPNTASKNPRRVAPLNSAVAGQHLEIAKTLIHTRQT